MTKEEYLNRYFEARHMGLRAVASDAWDAALSSKDVCAEPLKVCCTGCGKLFNFGERTGLDDSEYNDGDDFYCGGSPRCCP